MPKNVPIFALIALTPAPILAASAFWGGGWVWLALAYISGLSALLDLYVRKPASPADPDEPMAAANALSVTLALSHFLLLGAIVHALAGGSELSWHACLVLFIAAGFYLGQVSNSNAHELIHRRNPVLHNLGKWVYISLLFGHATSAHLKVHHRWAASPKDPLWPRGEEHFYRFAPRAWIGSFVEGYRAENAPRRAGAKARIHPYVTYMAGHALVLLLAGLLAGLAGIIALLALAVFTHMQLLLSDYVQHYGLRRQELPNGKLEPMTAAHSWNSHHWFTSFMMLNAPRHSDHHDHPTRPYPALRLHAPEIAPKMPYSLPVMGMIALIPPLWQRMMRHEIANWHALRDGVSA